MSVITKLGFQRNQRRVNIYLDDKFAFGLSTIVALEHRLKKNLKISLTKIKKIIIASLKEELYEACLGFLTIRPRSEKEIRDYLKRKIKKYFASKVRVENLKLVEKSESLINETVKRLKKNGFINDLEFSYWFVKQRINFRPRGKRVLGLELRQKGISSEFIDEVLKDKSLYPIKVEEEAARKIALKAFKQLTGSKAGKGRELGSYKLRQRLYGRLVSRGFSFETIKKAVDEIIKKE